MNRIVLIGNGFDLAHGLATPQAGNDSLPACILLYNSATLALPLRLGSL